jgi:hypothetical protein
MHITKSTAASHSRKYSNSPCYYCASTMSTGHAIAPAKTLWLRFVSINVQTKKFRPICVHCFTSENIHDLL